MHGQSCPTLCSPVDCHPPGSSVHGVLQARILERVTISTPLGNLPNPGVKPVSLALAGRFFYHWATYFWFNPYYFHYSEFLCMKLINFKSRELVGTLKHRLMKNCVSSNRSNYVLSLISTFSMWWRSEKNLNISSCFFLECCNACSLSKGMFNKTCFVSLEKE